MTPETDRAPAAFGWLLHLLMASMFLESVGFGRDYTAGRGLAVVVLLVVPAAILLTPTWRSRLVPATWVPAVLFLSWVWASGLWAEEFVAWILAMGGMLLAAAYFVAFALLLRGPRQLRSLLCTFVLAGVATTFVAFGQAASGARAVGLQGDPNLFAMYAIAAIPAALALVGSATGWHRTFWALAMLLLLAGVFLSGSRGGLLALLAVTVGIAFRLPSLLPGADMRKVATIGGAAVAVVVVAFGPATFDRLSAASEDRGTGRLDTWRVAWASAQDHPLHGLGAGNFVEKSRKLLETEPGVELIEGPLLLQGRGLEVHNVYLATVADYGLIGLALFLLLIGTTWSSLRDAYHRLPRVPALASLELMLVAFLVGTLFISSLNNKLLWILAGVAAALQRRPLPADTFGTVPGRVSIHA